MMRQSRRVLVAEQSAAKRLDITERLEQLTTPIELTEASTFEDCCYKLKKAKKQPFDVALIGGFSDIESETLPARLVDLVDETVTALISDDANPALFEKAAASSVIYDCLIAPLALQDLKRVIKRANISKEPLPTLIVDDTRVMRKVVMKVLNESQFPLAVSEADSCEMAVSLCRKIPYYCIFLDLNMPVQDGLETARQILKLQPKCRIVLMSTSHGDMDDKVEENGLACFLPKPFYPKDVNRLLHDFIGLAQPNLSDPDFVASKETVAPPPDQTSQAKDESDYFLL